MNINNTKKKTLVLFLLSLILVAAADYLWCFSIRVNVNPFVGSPDYKYEFKDIKQISEWYVPSDSSRALIEWDSNSNATINVRGFAVADVKDLGPLLERGHPSVCQTIYSMSYLAVALEQLINSHEMTPAEREKKLTRILDATDEILKKLRAPFPIDPMKMNDHARSVRAEYLALLVAYLESNLGLCPQDRTATYRRQLNEEVECLMDPRLFTWNSNHGLMQIRAQLTVARMLKNCELKNKLAANGELFIQDTIHYLVADDGAVLESASGYWFFICRMITLSYDNLPDKNSPTAKALHASITQMHKFLLTISLPGGYYQGLGDSQSGLNTITESNGKATDAIKSANAFFAFSNQFAGINTIQNNVTRQLLFVSLDTPPTVHKHPDDLACYFLIGKPYFANPGTYGYDTSRERQFVLSDSSQSTVIPDRLVCKRIDQSTKSQLDSCEADLPNKKYVLKGSKWYNDKKISRTIEYSLQNGFLKITDVSDDIKNLCSQFNISPDVTIESIGKNSVLLNNGIEAVRVDVVEGSLKENKSWVSPTWLKKQDITQLQVYGNPVIINISFKPLPEAPMVNLVGNLRPLPPRLSLSKSLPGKYKATFHPRLYPLTRMTYGRIGVAVIFLFLGWLSLVKFAKYRSVALIYIICVLAIYLADFVTSGYLLTFTYV